MISKRTRCNYFNCTYQVNLLLLLLHVADARRHVASLTALLKASRLSARRPASATVVCRRSEISWLHLLLGRPLPLLPSTIPSNICFSRQSCLLMCPKYFSLRLRIESSNQFSGMLPSWSLMEALVLFSVHWTLSSFL